MLLVPFAVLIPKSNLVGKIIVLLCYLIPTFALIIFGRNGNISLITVSIILLVLLYMRARIFVIDFTLSEAYNN